MAQILAGRLPLVALLDGLEERPDTPYFTKFGAQREFTQLLFTSPPAKEICRRFSAGKIWLISSTYNTNRYVLPLMHVVGITATHQAFTFAFWFTAGERAEDYLKALRHITRIF